LPAGSLPANAGAAYQFVRSELSKAGIATLDMDAALLLEWVTGLDRLAILSRPDAQLTDAQIQSLTEALNARLAGKPVHRLLGRRVFFGMQFDLSDETLEPRPDTECVVELALKALSNRKHDALSLLDLGTGSGIIAISLLSRFPNARAIAADISEDALATACGNAESNGVAGRFQALKSDWFDKVEDQFDLIISNPPYISSAEIASLSREVREHDPLAALDGGEDGLDAYRLIAGQARSHLREGGYLALEIGHDQRESVTGICVREGLIPVEAATDLGGNDRALLFGL
jgi:release factor glutamine methyltransferase